MSSKEYTIITKADEKRKKRKELLLGLFSGVLLGISFPPFPLYPLLFVALIPYFFVLERRNSLASINRFTYATIFVYNLIALYWVGGWQPETDPFLMIAGTTLLFFNPIVFLIPSTLYYFARKSFGKRVALYMLPFFWGTMEYLYSITEFRFPWLTLGHSLSYFHTFIQIADIIGSFGLGILAIFINICFYTAYKNYTLRKKYFFHLGAGIILLVIPFVYGMIAINSYTEFQKRVDIGIVQPNLNPWNKWEAGNANEQLELYLNMSQEEVAKGAKLVIWPETALPVYLMAGGHRYEVQRIRNFCDTNDVSIMTGMPDATFYFDEEKIPEEAKTTRAGNSYTSYNSILLFQPHNDGVQKYGKIKLVPFGEKVPLVEHIPFLGDLFKWEVGISSWNTGQEQTIFDDKIGADSIRIAGIICIESIYPDFVAGFVNQNAQLIVVVTNDSWYGDSSGPYQHEAMSILRAVENRRSVVRSANGGISCVIDPVGNILINTTMYEQAGFTFPVPLKDELTFYTKYPLILPIISLIISIGVVLLAIVNIFRKKKI